MIVHRQIVMVWCKVHVLEGNNASTVLEVVLRWIKAKLIFIFFKQSCAQMGRVHSRWTELSSSLLRLGQCVRVSDRWGCWRACCVAVLGALLTPKDGLLTRADKTFRVRAGTQCSLPPPHWVSLVPNPLLASALTPTSLTILFLSDSTVSCVCTHVLELGVCFWTGHFLFLSNLS